MFETLHGISRIGDSDRCEVTDVRGTVCGYIEPYCPQRVLACAADGRVIVIARDFSDALAAVIGDARSTADDSSSPAAMS